MVRGLERVGGIGKLVTIINEGKGHGISGAAAMQHSLAKITKCSVLRWCSG